jgi:hypothetical protein
MKTTLFACAAFVVLALLITSQNAIVTLGQITNVDTVKLQH